VGIVKKVATNSGSIPHCPLLLGVMRLGPVPVEQTMIDQAAQGWDLSRVKIPLRGQHFHHRHGRSEDNVPQPKVGEVVMLELVGTSMVGNLEKRWIRTMTPTNMQHPSLHAARDHPFGVRRTVPIMVNRMRRRQANAHTGDHLHVGIEGVLALSVVEIVGHSEEERGEKMRHRKVTEKLLGEFHLSLCVFYPLSSN